MRLVAARGSVILSEVSGARFGTRSVSLLHVSLLHISLLLGSLLLAGRTSQAAEFSWQAPPACPDGDSALRSAASIDPALGLSVTVKIAPPTAGRWHGRVEANYADGRR